MNITFNSWNDKLTFGKYAKLVKEQNHPPLSLKEFRDIYGKFSHFTDYLKQLLTYPNITFSEELKEDINKMVTDYYWYKVEYNEKIKESHPKGRRFQSLGSYEDDKTFVECFYDGDGI